MRKLFGALAGAVALSAATSAGAATFNLASSAGASSYTNGSIHGYQMTVDGITLTVTIGHYTDAGVITEGAHGARPTIYNGYGTGSKYNSSDEHTIDGNGYNEVVLLRFSEDVILESVLFGYFFSDDHFDFFADNDDPDTALNYLYSGIDIPGSSYLSPGAGLYVFANIWQGNIFGIGASGKYDAFKLKGLTVSKLPEVPLPAALPLFLAGAAGVGFMSRRRKAARA
ncbi:MAG: VPLPA-CTERM sorting domain-containing protein [Pseudomonadota bacterium]|nr:VPLPA-CTERM sorting domain-containing protein [Pseudomonadota bacterium]